MLRDGGVFWPRYLCSSGCFHVSGTFPVWLKSRRVPWESLRIASWATISTPTTSESIRRTTASSQVSSGATRLVWQNHHRRPAHWLASSQHPIIDSVSQKTVKPSPSPWRASPNQVKMNHFYCFPSKMKRQAAATQSISDHRLFCLLQQKVLSHLVRCLKQRSGWARHMATARPFDQSWVTMETRFFCPSQPGSEASVALEFLGGKCTKFKLVSSHVNTPKQTHTITQNYSVLVFFPFVADIFLS